MNIKDAWDKAEVTGEPVDIGIIVICDTCNKDYTDSLVSGGFIFVSSAICPACAKRSMSTIEKYNETKHIRAKCPLSQSFASFVRDYRGNNTKISKRKL